MSGNEPPLEGSARSLALVPAASARLDLTRDEISVLAAFRAMDARAKQESLVRMARIAGDHPSRAGLRLRVITGGQYDRR